MIARVLFCFALLCGSVQLASAAPATAAATLLTEADHRYDELDYRGAADLAQRVIDESLGTPTDQARALERLGLCWLVLGQNKLAEEAFDKLFTLEPTRKVVEPSLSPRQREFIERVRAKHPAAPVVETPVIEAPPVTPPVVIAEPPKKKPLVKRWYLWTPIAAAVVVGVGLGVGLGLGLPHAGPKGSLATVGLSLHF